MPTKAKREKVQLLKEKFERARAVFFTDYRGLDANAMNELRQLMRNTDAEYTIAKNTLLKVAHPEVELTGPTAVLFAPEDPLPALKALTNFKKKFGKPTFKLGFFEGQTLTESQIEDLASLPSREILLGQAARLFASPIYRLETVLLAKPRQLAAVLNQIAKKTKNQPDH